MKARVLFYAGLLVLCFLSGGCASFIAKQVMNPGLKRIESDLHKVLTSEQVCSDNNRCIQVTSFAADDPKNDFIKAKNLSLSFKLNTTDTQKVWKFKNNKTEPLHTQVLQDDIIVVLPGYMLDPKLLTFKALWLQRITGAQVFVAPNPDAEDSFSFGLNYVEPLKALIDKRNARRTHIVGVSMGAVAATELSLQVNNATLHLIAPMINFDYSLNALYRLYSANRLIRLFVSQDDIDNAAEIVLKRSGITRNDLDIMHKLNIAKPMPIFMYASMSDDVVNAAQIYNDKLFNRDDVSLNVYYHLEHEELVALFDEELLADYVSHITNTSVHPSEKKLVGGLCPVNDNVCVDALENM